MNRIKHSGWELLVAEHISNDEAKSLFKVIDTKTYEVTKSLKVHHRSVVLRIKWNKKDLVLKIPTEKNNRRWIRFLTWFRKGESFKNILGMLKLWEHGIKTTVPLMAAQKRSLGMVTDSWLVYEYLEGTTCLNHSEYFEDVVSKLSDMHSQGMLHGDPQIRNFVAKDDDIYIIDCNPKPAGYFGFSKAYEFAYLRRSQPELEKYFGKLSNWWLYKFARWYDLTERKFKEKKRNFTKAVKDVFS